MSTGINRVYANVLKKVFNYGRSLCKTKDIHSAADEVKYIPEDFMNLDFEPHSKEFELIDVCKFVSAAAKAIVDDKVTKRFNAEELETWNLLTRTYNNYHYVNLKITLVWFIGCFVRYFILLPSRALMVILSLNFIIIGSLGLKFVPSFALKTYLHYYSLFLCRLSIGTLSIYAEYHDQQYKPRHGVCVANHTTPLDFIILGSDGEYRSVGQLQSGFFGLIQRNLSRAGHIFFDRKSLNDRNAVSKILKEHVSHPDLPPILIFPEGTCINNTSVMLFRKGTFELSDTVHPVAIKYKPMFGDPFWNSSSASYGRYLMNIATSWFICCDVWYLPAMTRAENESSISFAGRVQKEIAMKAKIVRLAWDGDLKRSIVPPSLKAQKQREYAQSLQLFDRTHDNSENIIEINEIGTHPALFEELLFDSERVPNGMLSQCSRNND